MSRIVSGNTPTWVSAGEWARPRLFAVFFISGLVAFLPETYSARTPDQVEILLRTGISASLLFTTLWMRRQDVHKEYWVVFYGFFVASTAQLVDWYFSDWAISLLGIRLETPAGIAITKLESTLLIVATIIILTRLAGGDLASLYLRRGRARWWIPIALVTILFFAATSFIQAIGSFRGQNLSLERVLPWLPWVAIFTLANGLSEELLFRGLFLQKLEPFLGQPLSNLLIGSVFALWHLDIKYTSDLIGLLPIIFALGLFFGLVIQKTKSLWGGALSHAGADIPVIVGYLSTLA